MSPLQFASARDKSSAKRGSTLSGQFVASVTVHWPTDRKCAQSFEWLAILQAKGIMLACYSILVALSFSRVAPSFVSRAHRHSKTHKDTKVYKIAVQEESKQTCSAHSSASREEQRPADRTRQGPFGVDCCRWWYWCQETILPLKGREASYVPLTHYCCW